MEWMRFDMALYNDIFSDHLFSFHYFHCFHFSINSKKKVDSFGKKT